MAYGPIAILDLELINQDLVNRFETAVDNYLIDPQHHRDIKMSVATYGYIPVQFNEVLSDNDMAFVKEKYVRAGWRFVEIFIDQRFEPANHFVTVIRLYE